MVFSLILGLAHSEPSNRFFFPNPIILLNLLNVKAYLISLPLRPRLRLSIYQIDLDQSTAMDIIKAILPCFPLESSSHRTITTAANPQIPNEKQIIYRQPSTLHTDEKTALRVLSVLQTTEKSPGPALSATIDSIVHEAGGWKESIAKYVLAKLEAVIKAGEQMSPIMKKAYDWAYEEALKIIGFGKEHPVFYTVVAIGVLLFLAPYVLEVLGFGTLEAIGFGLEGPIEGRSSPSSSSSPCTLSLLLQMD